ncbi:hypothetical protein [Caulobacter sp. 17J80-11]|uniref:hypothetical protein n=1 Tax=Caulobacter sp. 17J80-11 TaxID=2763502 RepID=UPI0016536F1F|nr:hypothetical protein [Caulobacter sp. 17J80-11]MBC6981869.1 hypothetical protein [Caulobacter sp. 17J80-11]
MTLNGEGILPLLVLPLLGLSLLVALRFEAIGGAARMGARAPRFFSWGFFDRWHAIRFVWTGEHRELRDPVFSLLIWGLRLVTAVALALIGVMVAAPSI